MGIRDEEFKKLVKKMELLESKLKSNRVSKSSEFETLYLKYQKKILLIRKVKALKQQIKQTTSIMQMEELKSRKRVLRRLGYTTANDVIEVKGRVACEISTSDELMLTEMIFNGVFNDLTVPQIVSLLSCFVSQEKTEDIPKIRPDLQAPYQQLQDTAKRIAKLEKECKLPTIEEDYVASFKPDLIEIVYAWCEGAKFAQICKMTEIFEGNIIRSMKRLEELLRQMCSAAKSIGNTELENKFAEGIHLIKRDIVFAASLYL